MSDVSEPKDNELRELLDLFHSVHHWDWEYDADRIDGWSTWAREYNPDAKRAELNELIERMDTRLASAARPEQVTMTAREFVQWWYDGYPINHDPILIVADPDFYTKHPTPQQDGAE